MLHFKLFEWRTRAAAAIRRFAAYVKHEAHHAQAVLYVAGAVVYQVAVGAGGFDVVRHWTLKEWVGRILITGGPALLFLLRGKHQPVDPDASKVVDAVRGKSEVP